MDSFPFDPSKRPVLADRYRILAEITPAAFPEEILFERLYQALDEKTGLQVTVRAPASMDERLTNPWFLSHRNLVRFGEASEFFPQPWGVIEARVGRQRPWTLAILPPVLVGGDNRALTLRDCMGTGTIAVDCGVAVVRRIARAFMRVHRKTGGNVIPLNLSACSILFHKSRENPRGDSLLRAPGLMMMGCPGLLLSNREPLGIDILDRFTFPGMFPPDFAEGEGDFTEPMAIYSLCVLLLQLAGGYDPLRQWTDGSRGRRFFSPPGDFLDRPGGGTAWRFLKDVLSGDGGRRLGSLASFDEELRVFEGESSGESDPRGWAKRAGDFMKGLFGMKPDGGKIPECKWCGVENPSEPCGECGFSGKCENRSGSMAQRFVEFHGPEGAGRYAVQRSMDPPVGRLLFRQIESEARDTKEHREALGKAVVAFNGGGLPVLALGQTGSGGASIGMPVLDWRIRTGSVRLYFEKRAERDCRSLVQALEDHKGYRDLAEEIGSGKVFGREVGIEILTSPASPALKPGMTVVLEGRGGATVRIGEPVVNIPGSDYLVCGASGAPGVTHVVFARRAGAGDLRSFARALEDLGKKNLAGLPSGARLEKGAGQELLLYGVDVRGIRLSDWVTLKERRPAEGGDAVRTILEISRSLAGLVEGLHGEGYGLSNMLAGMFVVSRKKAQILTPTILKPLPKEPREADRMRGAQARMAGRTVAELLTGLPRNSRLEDFAGILTAGRGMPPSVPYLVMAALDEGSRRPYGSVEELGKDLDRILEGKPIGRGEPVSIRCEGCGKDSTDPKYCTHCGHLRDGRGK